MNGSSKQGKGPGEPNFTRLTAEAACSIPSSQRSVSRWVLYGGKSPWRQGIQKQGVVPSPYSRLVPGNNTVGHTQIRHKCMGSEFLPNACQEGFFALKFSEILVVWALCAIHLWPQHRRISCGPGLAISSMCSLKIIGPQSQVMTLYGPTDRVSKPVDFCRLAQPLGFLLVCLPTPGPPSLAGNSGFVYQCSIDWFMVGNFGFLYHRWKMPRSPAS